MLLKYFYDPALAHASYLVGCQKTGEAIIVDPGRDIESYLHAAQSEGMEIVGAADTHIHADYVSGARELADRVGAKLYVSDEGPAEWKYEYASQYEHRLLKEGDTFQVGKIEFEVIHTPGHTPESICFILTDKGGGADKPMGIFTGDFVFVGSIGRPDLLEEAAGIMGTAEPGARDLFQSIKKFRELPDHLQVWPAHGAGSACGKGLGAIPSSTVGYEKLFNPALQFNEEQAFVDYILSEQPEAPKYFAMMKRVNKEGPEILGEATLPTKIDTNALLDTVDQHIVVDTSARFAEAHVAGTLSIQTKYLAMWGGSILDYDQPVFLIASQRELPEAVRILRKIGMDRIKGFFDLDEVASSGLATANIPQKTAEQVAPDFKTGAVEMIDVRGLSERHEERIPGTQHSFLGKLLQNADQLDSTKTYVFQCRSGGRSMIAASIAKHSGIENVINLVGGIEAWKSASLPVDSGQSEKVEV